MSVRRALSLLPTVALIAGTTVAAGGLLAAPAGADPAPVAPAGIALGFGYNNVGQLGTGTTTTATAPVEVSVPGSARVTQVSAGSAHSVALTSDGQVWAWGDNTYGELGTNSTTASLQPAHVQIPSGVTVTAVAAGYYDSFALSSTGAVYGWGLNNAGQLGNGGTAPATVPTVVSLPAGVIVTAISTGYAHTLALTSTGAAYAWGYNNSGQLGDATLTSRVKPVAVHLPSGTTLTSVSAGYLHSLAVTSTGGVLGWGSNSSGQVGNGSAANVLAPVALNVGTATVTAVSGGGAHSLAATSTGGVLAWGDNTSAQFGRGNATSSSTPVSIPGLTGIAAVAAGYDYSLFETAAGGVLGAGDNRFGSLGAGTTTSFYATPVAAALPAAAPVAAIAASVTGLHSFAVVPLAATTTTVTSALNPTRAGQATLLTATVTGVPGGTVAFGLGGSTLPGCASAPLKLVSGSTYRASCSVATLPVGTDAVRADYAGDDFHGASSGPVSQQVQDVAGVATDWGYNATGQLGDGTTTARALPVPPQLPDGVTVTAVTSDSVHTLALTSTGAVYAWGDNTYGELGDGTTTSSRTPVKVAVPAGIVPVAISAGYYDSFLVSATGAVYAWGINTYGELGTGTTATTPTPTRVVLPSGTVATQASAGFGHTLVLTAAGDVYAVGLNNFGQLGLGTITAISTPAKVTLAGGAVASAVSAGYDHSIAVTGTGGVQAWGDNTAGALGSATGAASASPIAVPLPAGVHAVEAAAAYRSTLIRTADGAAYAWGYNAFGELGNGTTTSSAAPVAVALPTGTVLTSIAAETFSGMGLTADGHVYAWGDNTYGELGTGTATASTTPVAVDLPAGGAASAIGAGGYSLTGSAIVPRIASHTTVTSTPNPSTYGQTVTLTATVAPADGGTVTFSADGTTVCAAVPLAAGTATCTSSALEVGNHVIAAAYAGDRLYQPSAGTVDGGQLVQKIATTTTVGSSVAAGQTGTYGQPITLTATVANSDGGGSVAFNSDGSVIAGCGAQPLAAGTATCTSSAIPGGSHVITADYSGDAHYAASSGTLAGPLVVKITTKLVSQPVKLTNLLAKPIYKTTLTALPDGTPIAGQTIKFIADIQGGVVQCTAVTDVHGFASCQGGLLGGLGTYRAVYDGTSLYYSSLGYSSITL